jgi:hypothetical protein
MSDHSPSPRAPETAAPPVAEPVAEMLHDLRNEAAGYALVLSRIDTLLTDAESVWFTERTAARQLVQRAHQLSTEALR